MPNADWFDPRIAPVARVALAALKKGQRVRVEGYGGGPAAILRVEKTGAIWVRLDDGLEGTTTIHSLRFALEESLRQ